LPDPRPAADGYVPGAEGGGTYSFGSNYGPTNETFLLGEDDPETRTWTSPKPMGSTTWCVRTARRTNARILAHRVAEARNIDMDSLS
jgi:hypothetical protein